MFLSNSVIPTTGDVMLFFAFSTIRIMSSELIAAKVASYFDNHLPNTLFVQKMHGAGLHWIAERTSFHDCDYCFTPVIDRERSLVCPECRYHNNVEMADLQKDCEESAAIQEAQHWADYDEQERQIDELYYEYSELDMACTGGCRETIQNCVCSEMDSYAQHNADPATRGSWWIN